MAEKLRWYANDVLDGCAEIYPDRNGYKILYFEFTDSIKQWLKDKCPNSYKIHVNTAYNDDPVNVTSICEEYVEFENEEAAALFKLTWR